MIKFWKDKSGAVSVESGLVSIPFFLFLFIIIDVTFLFLASTTINVTVRETAKELELNTNKTAAILYGKSKAIGMFVPNITITANCYETMHDLDNGTTGISCASPLSKYSIIEGNIIWKPYFSSVFGVSNFNLDSNTVITLER